MGVGFPALPQAVLGDHLRLIQQHHPAGAADGLHRPEPTDRPHQHHAFDAKIEHAGALREQLPERGKKQRRAIRDCGGGDHHQDGVVHAAPNFSGALANGAARRTNRIR